METEVIQGMLHLEYLNGVYAERTRLLQYLSTRDSISVEELVAFIAEGKNE